MEAGIALLDLLNLVVTLLLSVFVLYEVLEVHDLRFQLLSDLDSPITMVLSIVSPHSSLLFAQISYIASTLCF